MGLHIVLPVVHGVSMRAMRARCEDELLDVYIHTGNEAADFFSAAVWLQRSRSVLIQDIQPTRKIDSTCYNALIGEITTCSQMVHPFLKWPVNLIAGPSPSGPCSSSGDLNDIQSQSKTEKLGSNLCPHEEYMPKNSEFSSRMEMTKAHLLFQHLMPAHNFSALRIEEIPCGT